MTLVDANVLIDLLTDDPTWAEWSETALLGSAEGGEIAINPIIYAEVAAAFKTRAQLDAALALFGLVRLEMPYRAGFRAAKSFLAYRRKGGDRRSPLPDFYIGAHAEVAKLNLLTRDAGRYRTYFPKVRIVCP